jgi:hypothetical protein
MFEKVTLYIQATLLSENIMKHILFTIEFGRLRTIARKGAHKLPYRTSKIQFAISEAQNVGYWQEPFYCYMCLLVLHAA